MRREAGVQDFVIVTLKAHALPRRRRRSLARMMGPETALVTAINGVPYWYFFGLDGPYRDRRVASVDPGGVAVGRRCRRRRRSAASSIRRPRWSRPA